ncbi:MAG: ABC transporter, substrate-binding protein (cluster 1, maltose/g3p/polyamine/iron) [uncultured Thermomicrobiales bacterium]|uniref:ABC transporter, substrate-binding protein (Cluster 1, maltose/g3p/polyamine/iron) n=1 Tax=uncultured Thermomicrobiales bacterium TaxID=1645740 RepID=A0A6J4TIQ9_9BACT|nr:MAG: ABC transporter, substrate-binding protein (cluster 1, maltose/g3p/polyamine/iron) [uncultured Thermomicrobiales bacterium]
MTSSPFGRMDSLSRRRFLAAAAGLSAMAALPRHTLARLIQEGAAKTGVDPNKWNPETIQALAGTITVDTAAELHALVPQDTAGEVAYWSVGPTEASPQITKDLYDQFLADFATFYPNIELENQNVGYNDMLDKIRTAAAGKSAPDVAKMPILWGVEFAARGHLREIVLEDYGLSRELFWDGALKSVTWQDKMYGIPTNNETMGFIYNKKIFADAGLDPETPPATWADVVAYSKQIKDETGKNGYGMVAKVNAGNTPFRFMPLLWAHGSGALDEAEPNPTYEASMINNEGGVAALQAMYDMYVTDRSVPTSALTNTQVENQDLYIAGEIAMMISHPSEYVAMQGRAAEATGSDKERADEIVANMAYGLIPEGPVRRAVVFGGSNAHIFTDEAHGRPVDMNAAKALMATLTSPEWSLKNNWTDSNPANLRGFETQFMRQRLDEIKFLEVTTAMLPFGIPFPVVPESPEIMNIIVPDMLQNALTQSMTVKEAADDAAQKINALIAAR